MSIKTDLYELWTSKSMEQAKVIENSNQPHVVKDASRIVYRAYQEGLKALYLTDRTVVLERVLRRRLRNPFKAPRHATYVVMLHQITTAKENASRAKDAS